jgi:protein-S-isoprenylcysteine O-methyltransferase Ste14
VALLAAVALVAAPAGYDLGAFLGVRQLRAGISGAADDEPFRISTLHRFVRHPWYALCLAILWTRDMRLSGLVAAIAITLYFLVGSRLEERKLVERFGDRYRRYQERVPAWVPRPWRVLGREEARRLVGE